MTAPDKTGQTAMRMLTKITNQSTIDVITAGVCLGLLAAVATKPMTDLLPSTTLLVILSGVTTWMTLTVGVTVATRERRRGQGAHQ